jgi:glycosyltransferase involved in cell wall biosynthesis
VRRHRFEGEEYVLTVSTIEVRKNHLLLAKIWTECAAEGVTLPKLVLVGRFGWDVDELRRWVDHAPELDGRFLICTDVGDDELVALYQDALFTVFPSRIEGWGLPITEALSYGKVCVHSTDPAQFEASQGLMPALHPDDYLGWKAEIIRLCSDADYRVRLEADIDERYVTRTALEYCADFASILASRRRSGATT